MRKQYDDFTQLKLKDMSKSISDMTYKYINPETNTPTKVPPVHYEKILDQITERYTTEVISNSYITLMYQQLCNLKKEYPKEFNLALVCMDLGINPKDMRINEQIAMHYTSEFIEQKQAMEKKDYHFLNDEILDAFDRAKDDPDLQSHVVKESNKIEIDDDSKFQNRHYEREDR